MLCALIMAGGRGTRFWPLSTNERPKQFLSLIDEKTMIQMTIDRIKPIIPIERIFICTGKMYIDLIKEQIPELPERNIIVEPEGRNTAPCITLSALVIKRYYQNANMIVLPSDHLIKDEEEFTGVIKAADEFIVHNNNSIITFGMNPTRPEIGYGYIKCGQKSEKIRDYNVIKVDSFIEKPNREKAEEYIEQKRYLWNSGMFLWNIDNIINQIKMYIPNTYESLKDIEVVKELNLQQFIDSNYKDTDSISIDYAVLEKSNNIFVIPADIGWDDVGSWEAIERYKSKDNNGNIGIGNIKYINSENNLVVASNNNIIVNDLSNIYLIENEGKIIIGLKENISKLKELNKN